MIQLLKKLSLIILVISSQSFSQEANYKSLDEFLNILNDNNKLMATLTITKNGLDVYNKAIGFADVEAKIKNKEQVKYRIGSITKAFTAVMIFQLIEEGKINLETPLSQFYPKIAMAQDIKISNLLNHSSGLYNITNDPNAGEWILKPSTKDEMLSRFVAHELDFKPNEQTSYSNTNYMLLGYIIEALDNTTYSESLNKRIVNKINLDHTYYGGKINNKKNESYSYTIENESWVKTPETDMSNPGGAGAIVSTSGDLTTFMNALFNGGLIAPSSLETMKITENGEVCHGVFYANMNGVDLYASEGGIDGFQSMLVHVPVTKTTIALTANGLDFSKMRIILSAFAASNGQTIVLPNFSRIELTEEDVKLYEGEYASDKVPYNLIFKAKGTLLLGAPEQSKLKELTPTEQHQFTFDTLGIVLDFYPETGLVRYTKGEDEPLLFKKL